MLHLQMLQRYFCYVCSVQCVLLRVGYAENFTEGIHMLVINEIIWINAPSEGGTRWSNG